MNVFNDYINEMTIKEYAAKSIIFLEKEPCKHFCIILKGSVDIITYSLNDTPYFINSLSKNDCFGEYLLFSDFPIYLGNVVAKTEVKIGFLLKDKLLNLLKQNENLLNSFLNLLANKHLQLQNKLKVLSQKTISDKILSYVHLHANEHKTIFIKSKESLANILNIPRPSLSRTLIHLKNANMIDYNYHSITLK